MIRKWTLCRILLAGLLFHASAQVHPIEPCYPGLDCPPASTLSSTDALSGPTVAGLSFTQNFVLDTSRNLVWARDLYAIGDTTTLFREAYGGSQLFPAAWDAVKDRAANARIGSIAGWRLASKQDLDSLFERLDPTSIYVYFRPRPIPPPLSSVLGALDGSPSAHIPIDGMIYAGTAQGRTDGHLGTPERNKYGFWLVQGLSSDSESSLARIAEPLRRFVEPTEEQRIRPAGIYHLIKHDDSFEPADSASDFAKVSTTPALNERFYARYNLKPLPHGALVSAEVLMRGVTASGKPLPTVTVQITPAPVETLANPKDLWAFPNAVDVNIWQMTGVARLELPAHVIGNIYRLGGGFYLAFSANFNSCEFQIPELIVRYVRDENLLWRRQLP